MKASIGKYLLTYSIILIICSFINPIVAVNPFLPAWEFIPDGEPYVFDDPDHPGRQRVYLYGSHDSLKDAYCGRELVLWSADVDSLNSWRYDGIIFESKADAQGKNFREDARGDVLYAPDICEVTNDDGSKTYYLYPNNQAGGRKNMVAKSARPDGPFEVCNWSSVDPRRTEGCMDFDPAVFIDDDGRVYGYWGINTSWAAELDPTTMASVKPGTSIVKDMIPSKNQDNLFRFFEASSIRKIEGKYVFIYSRWTADGDFGLPQSNYTLAYAYADAPLGPYTYGGTIIDGRARDTNASGKTIFTACPNGNTHGSIVKIKDQWWVFYHRQTGKDEYSRQAMVAPIDVSVHDGKVFISEGEYNSEGFETEGLDPYKKYEAGIACYYTSPRPAEHHWPRKTFFGSYIASGRDTDFVPVQGGSHNPVVFNTDASIIGYKYFNFDACHGDKSLRLKLELVPLGQNGHIDIFIGNPQKNGRKVGRIKISSKLSESKDANTNSTPQKQVCLSTRVPKIARLSGKQALFLRFHLDSPQNNAAPADSSSLSPASLCELHYINFE